MFSFIQSLAFQYSLAFDWNNLGDHNIEIKMDVAATSGAYAMTTAIFIAMVRRYTNGDKSERLTRLFCGESDVAG